MACGDNPEANMTMSVSLLWIRTEQTPALGEQIRLVESWQYQSTDTAEFEYIPASAEYPGYLTIAREPITGIFASNLTTLVQEQLTALLGPFSEVWEEMVSLTPHNLGILRFRSNPCTWEIATADELTPEELGKLVQIPSCLSEARFVIVIACQSEL
eukprot:1959090-Pleurochrysis_carterae.AAC.1